MKMKLAAAAVAAALVAPLAAQADVTVFGLAQLELAQTKLGTADSKLEVLDSKNSRIGVRFTEDLGDGLKANGEFEWGPSLLDAATKPTDTNAGNGIYARQQWIGLSGGWGEFQIGTLLQPYKYSGGVKYDAFVATAMEARSSHGGMISSHFGAGGYFANAVGYKNTFGGVQVWLTYSPEKDADAATVYKGSKGDYNASIVVPFAGGEAGIAMAKDKYLTTEAANTAGEKNTKIFGKYSFGPSTVLAQYEKYDKAAALADGKVYFVAYQFKMGTNTFVAQLGKDNNDTNSADIKYGAIGVIHGFSKNTSGFLGYRKSDVTAADTATTGDSKALSAGLSIKF
jgi:predicted porin